MSTLSITAEKERGRGREESRRVTWSEQTEQRVASPRPTLLRRSRNVDFYWSVLTSKGRIQHHYRGSYAPGTQRRPRHTTVSPIIPCFCVCGMLDYGGRRKEGERGRAFGLKFTSLLSMLQPASRVLVKRESFFRDVALRNGAVLLVWWWGEAAGGVAWVLSSRWCEQGVGGRG